MVTGASANCPFSWGRAEPCHVPTLPLSADNLHTSRFSLAIRNQHTMYLEFDLGDRTEIRMICSFVGPYLFAKFKDTCLNDATTKMQ